VTARVVEVLAEEGKAVAQGETLARLDDSDAKKRLGAAKAGLEAARANVPVLSVNLGSAERELKRQQELEQGGVSSAQTLETATATRDALQAQIGSAREQVNVAQANVALAEQDVDSCTVRAPFAGMIVSKDAQPGEMVSPISGGNGFTRTGIATIVDMQSLEVEVDVSETYIAKVRPGQPVQVTLDAYPDWKIPAQVRTVIPTADRQKATVKVRIAFAALDPRILPDMGVKVAFLDDTTQAATPAAARALIPESAVRTQDGKLVVFVQKDGRVERRAVQLGAHARGEIEVTAGVSAGDRVVVVGPLDLHDGQEVEVKQ
jgi:RND family efflux transporter MFP subunit